MGGNHSRQRPRSTWAMLAKSGLDEASAGAGERLRRSLGSRSPLPRGLPAPRGLVDARGRGEIDRAGHRIHAARRCLKACLSGQATPFSPARAPPSRREGGEAVALVCGETFRSSVVDLLGCGEAALEDLVQGGERNHGSLPPTGSGPRPPRCESRCSFLHDIGYHGVTRGGARGGWCTRWIDRRRAGCRGASPRDEALAGAGAGIVVDAALLPFGVGAIVSSTIASMLTMPFSTSTKTSLNGSSRVSDSSGYSASAVMASPISVPVHDRAPKFGIARSAACTLRRHP